MGGGGSLFLHIVKLPHGQRSSKTSTAGETQNEVWVLHLMNQIHSHTTFTNHKNMFITVEFVKTVVNSNLLSSCEYVKSQSDRGNLKRSCSSPNKHVFKGIQTLRTSNPRAIYNNTALTHSFHYDIARKKILLLQILYLQQQYWRHNDLERK